MKDWNEMTDKEFEEEHPYKPNYYGTTILYRIYTIIINA